MSDRSHGPVPLAPRELTSQIRPFGAEDVDAHPD
jgi:hypothetical protein